MRYPYKDDEAGKLRDRHKTGNLSEALLADSQILSLARELLRTEICSEAEEQSRLLVGSRADKSKARAHLIRIIEPPPKRPIYYPEREIKSLPHWTRDALRFLGDYIDILVKAAVYGKMGNNGVFKSSLGPAIVEFRKACPQDPKVVDWLHRYNEFLYRDAKHDMKLPPNRSEHRFTSREVVLCLYVTRELANRIIGLPAKTSGLGFLIKVPRCDVKQPQTRCPLISLPNF
jgi:hypothetical protein